KDVTGALATAEVLGRFAQFGVMSAFYWGAPPQTSPSRFGFLAYRNFDGKGGRFLDLYVPTTSEGGVSLFASRDANGKHLVVIALNLSPPTGYAAQLDVASCGAVASRQAYVYTDGASAFAPSPAAQGDAGDQPLPPWSITVLDLHLR